MAAPGYDGRPCWLRDTARELRSETASFWRTRGDPLAQAHRPLVETRYLFWYPEFRHMQTERGGGLFAPLVHNVRR